MAYEIQVDDTLNHPVITLRNTATKHEVEVFCFGALLNAFRFPFEQTTINIVAGFPSAEDAKENIRGLFRSAKMSPFTVRMKEGKHTFNGAQYIIEKNYLQQHAIHGIVFDALFEIKDTITDQESASVVLHHHYDGTDNGYPWEYDLEITYRLSNGNMLSVTTMVHHTNPFAIPYADGWHPYFSLDTNIDACYLQMNNTAVVETDNTMIPTGNFLTDTRFNNKTYLDGILLDTCFVFDHSAGEPMAILSSEKLQLNIVTEASYPFIQFYTPDDRKSIAIECLSGAADCFNNKIGLRMIGPNEQASFTTHYIPSIIG